MFWSLPKELEAGFPPLMSVLHLVKVGGRGWGVSGSFWATGPPDGTREAPFKAELMVLVWTKMLWMVPAETGGQREDLGGDEEKQACSNWTFSNFYWFWGKFRHFNQVHLGTIEFWSWYNLVWQNMCPDEMLVKYLLHLHTTATHSLTQKHGIQRHFYKIKK